MASRRTTLYSSAGKKLYAVRNADGTFKDIQTYKRAHGADLRHKSAAERLADAKRAAKKAVKKVVGTVKKAAKKVTAKKSARKPAKKASKKSAGRK